jgi:hypothetical protein
MVWKGILQKIIMLFPLVTNNILFFRILVHGWIQSIAHYCMTILNMNIQALLVQKEANNSPTPSPREGLWVNYCVA